MDKITSMLVLQHRFSVMLYIEVCQQSGDHGPLPGGCKIGLDVSSNNLHKHWVPELYIYDNTCL